MKTTATQPKIAAEDKAPRATAQPDHRPAAVAQRQQQDAIAASPRQQAPAVPASLPAPNRTGLPDALKTGVENLSGYSLDDVRVHYNSAQPAQLEAHAYAQGTDIHLAPGQEQHLPHEAWHVVQQKQGRVQATRQLKGAVPVNDDAGLEKEADVMGTRATQASSPVGFRALIQQRGQSSGPVQRKLGPYLNAAALEPLVQASQLAREALQVPAIINFINTTVIPDIKNWEAHSTGDPTAWADAKKKSGKIWILKDTDTLAKWLVRLMAYYRFPDDSVSGFAADHSSQVATKTAHDKNWERFVVERLAKLPVKVDSSSNPYKHLYQQAKKAAHTLDLAKANSSAVELQAVHVFAEYVKENGSGTVTPSVPQWKTEGPYGTGIRVKATYLPGYTMPKGSGDSITTPLDWFYSGRTQDGVSAYYVKGHLLNDHVGGLARNYNLSPLKANRNKEHEAAIEHNLKESVRQMTNEQAAGLTPTFKQIIYTTELGPQTGPRAITLAWQQALAFWNTQRQNKGKYNKTFLQQLLIDPAVDENVKRVIRSWNLNYFITTMPQVYAWVHTSALLLETEDALVRDWYVHLRLIHNDDSTDDQFAHLQNSKLNQFKVLVKTPLDAPATRGAANLVVDTQPLSANRPTAINKILHDLPEDQLASLLQHIRGTEYSNYNITDPTQVEKYPEVAVELINSFTSYLKNQAFQQRANNVREVLMREDDLETLQGLYKRIFRHEATQAIDSIKLALVGYLYENTQGDADIQLTNELERARKVVALRREQQAHASQHSLVSAFQIQPQANPFLPQERPDYHALPQLTNSLPQFSLLEASSSPESSAGFDVVDYITKQFGTLFQYEAGAEMLMNAISFLERTAPEQQKLYSSAWALILGKLLNALRMNEETLIREAITEGHKLLEQPVAVNAVRQVWDNDLQDYIAVLAEINEVDDAVILADLHSPEPNIRLHVLHHLEQLRRLMPVLQYSQD